MELKEKKVAILVSDGFEQSEFEVPYSALKDTGAETHVVSLKEGEVRGWDGGDWGKSWNVDLTVPNANPSDYDALVLPGGVINPDTLRGDEGAIAFVRSFFEQGKPVSAICHGPQVLITAEVVEGRTLTSYSTIAIDLKNAGANWIDEEVVVDQGLVTSRNPNDLPAFCGKMLEEIQEGKHEAQHA